MEEYNSQNSFKTYRLSPHWLQYVINQLPWLIICLCGFLFAGDDTLPYRSYILIASMGLMVYLLYLAIDMKRIEYVITGEQLIYKHGVLFHTADFMELYRIVDYQEHRTPMQQIIGLKNVTLLSGDRSMPRGNKNKS